MKTIKMIFAAMILCGLAWQACQKEESGLLYKDVETMQLKTGDEAIDCETDCIDPENSEYFDVHDQIVIGWAGPDNNKFNKTINIVYYNTLDEFVLKVMSTNGIADVLMNDESIKNFEGTVPPDTWQEITFPLADDWAACDTWEFELKIAGFGPPAYFDVEYQLIGECVYYTLSLTVQPEGAGTVSGAGDYKAGDEIELTATANEGYVFVNWTDGDDTEISNLPDFTYTMPAMDKTLTAIFEEEEEVFVCGESTITDIDGNVYNTVLIGDQCWTKENLKTTHYHNGTLIEYPGADNNEWVNNTTGAYAWFDNDISWKDSYGALYNWYAVSNTHALCPAGWHVPSDSDWTDLVNYVVDQGFPNELSNPDGAGNALKSCRQVNSPIDGDCNTSEHPRWESNDIHHGFDEFGFSAHQGRRRTASGTFVMEGPLGNWWSSTENSTADAWSRFMASSRGNVSRNRIPKVSGFSVRCVIDNEN